MIPANVSVKQLGNLSEMLRSRGLISEITSFTLMNAGDKFDRFGVTKDIDVKFNALEYFATQLDAIQNNGLNGNAYGKNLIPEFKKAIYVLQNLKTYGEGNAATPADQEASKPRLEPPDNVPAQGLNGSVSMIAGTLRSQRYLAQVQATTCCCA